MAVKWIGDAARELGISPLDAVEYLAARQEYPMNGLLDEDRFQMLRILKASRRGTEISGTGAIHLPPQVHPPAVPAVATPEPPPMPPPSSLQEKTAPAPPPTRVSREETSVTAPIPIQTDRGEERTVILPPPTRP